ncbi:MAG: agmatinase [Oscillospiraceae bacterium]
MNKNVHTFLGCESSFEEADIVLFGAPFDGTTSYRPGARFGPSAIRGESFGIETYSPYQNRDLAELKVCDAGDLELPFGNTPKALAAIGGAAAHILQAGKTPFMLGGEHLATLPAVSAALQKYPGLCVVQFDAHADLRSSYLGEELSHATVMHRVWQRLGSGGLYQFGIRSGEKQEFEFAKKNTRLHPFTLNGFAAAVKELQGRPVYFTLDLDVLDPSVFPGTGTPEPGGVSFAELLEAVLLLRQLRVVACDVNELSPVYDASGASTAAACKIVREILLTFKGA